MFDEIETMITSLCLPNFSQTMFNRTVLVCGSVLFDPTLP